MNLLEASQKYFAADNFVRACGIEITECREGYARCEVKIAPMHINGANTAQGGLLYTIADFTGAVAGFSLGRVVLTINADISYFKSCNTGTIIAEATVLSATNKLCTCNVDVHNDAGERLATAKVGLYRTNQEIEEIFK